MLFDEIKAHISRHKTAYTIGVIIGVAGITYLIMKGRTTSFLRSLDGPDVVTNRPFTFFSNRTNIVTVIAREGRGHPGYLIQCKETGDIFSSQAGAASWIGTSTANMSQHISGRFPDVYGLHFERIAA